MDCFVDTCAAHRCCGCAYCHSKLWRRLIQDELNTAARSASRPLTSYHSHADAWETLLSTCRLDLTGKKHLTSDAVARARSVYSLDPRAAAGPEGFGPLASQRRLWPPPDRAAQHSMKSTLSWQRPMSRAAPPQEWWERPKRSCTAQGSRRSSRSSRSSQRSRSSAWVHPLSSSGGSRQGRSTKHTSGESGRLDRHGSSSARTKVASGPPDGSDITPKIGYLGAPQVLEKIQTKNYRVLDRTGRQLETALRFNRDVNYTMQGTKWPPPKV